MSVGLVVSLSDATAERVPPGVLAAAILEAVEAGASKHTLLMHPNGGVAHVRLGVKIMPASDETMTDAARAVIDAAMAVEWEGDPDSIDPDMLPLVTAVYELAAERDE